VRQPNFVEAPVGSLLVNDPKLLSEDAEVQIFPEFRAVGRTVAAKSNFVGESQFGVPPRLLEDEMELHIPEVGYVMTDASGWYVATRPKLIPMHLVVYRQKNAR